MTTANLIPGAQKGKSKPVIGLIGGIGAGKSQVAAVFARKGARVIAADDIAHNALRQPELRQQVVERWGADLLDREGQIQRKRLGAIVFADAEERRALEGILHPWIRQRIRAEVEAAEAGPSVHLVVLDAAIMLEMGWNEICDWLVYIDAPRPIRLQRVAQQRGWSVQEVEARERAQMPLTDKVARADHVLDNSGSLEHLERQVDELLIRLDLGHSLAPP
jgi:dephospho-CoA kinase